MVHWLPHPVPENFIQTWGDQSLSRFTAATLVPSCVCNIAILQCGTKFQCLTDARHSSALSTEWAVVNLVIFANVHSLYLERPLVAGSRPLRCGNVYLASP